MERKSVPGNLNAGQEGCLEVAVRIHVSGESGHGFDFLQKRLADSTQCHRIPRV